MPRPPVPAVAAPEIAPVRPRKLAAIVAATAFGFAIEMANGYYDPVAIKLVTLGIVALLAGLIAGERQLPPRWAQQAYLVVLALALMLQLSALTSFPPLKQTELHGHLTLWHFELAACGAYFLALLLQLTRPSRVLGALLMLGMVWVVWWVVEQQPAPPIDVWQFSQDGARSLLHGNNPFSMTFENLYKNASPYAPSMASSTRVLHGYPYPPLNLVPAMLGLIGGDCRYGFALCLAIVAALLGFVENAWLFAVLLVLTPRSPMMLEQAFIEPVGILFVAIAAVASGRWPKAVPVAVGLAIASKQVNLLFMPAALLLPELHLSRARLREQLRPWAIALGIAAATFLPFFLAAPRAMYDSLVGSQSARMHHNPDTLTFATPFAMRTGEQLSASVTVGLYLATLGLLYVFAPRTRVGFALGAGMLSVAFFVCNRQANINYYFFMLSCFWIAAAVDSPHRELARA